MATLIVDDRGRVTIPLSMREEGGIKAGDALRMVRSEDGWRLTKLGELGPVARQVFEEIAREGDGGDIEDYIREHNINVEQALRDVTFP